jgi:two-component system nitrate/nitrite response regulator NarL
MTNQETEIRLATICPQPLIALGIARTFQDEPGMKIVQELTSLVQIEREFPTSRPHVVLIDWDLVPHDLESTDHVRKLSTRAAVMLLMYRADSNNTRVAFELGARGTLDKSCAPTIIRRAVQKVAKGGIWVERNAADELLEHVLSPSNTIDDSRSRIEWLTRRERQIVDLVCHGYRNKRIADELHIAETTVCHHLTSVYNKLNVKDRLGLLVFSHQNVLAMTVKSESRRHSPVRNEPIRRPGHIAMPIESGYAYGRASATEN